MARIGRVNKISSVDFASFVAEKLATTVRFVDAENEIERVAVCGGSGMSFLDDVISMGADAYVTGDISHHEMLDAKDKGITVIAAGHFETEYPSMYALKNYVAKEFSDVETVVLLQNNPVKFIS
jgi:putative NIF3 family GTP cyclohydrolase 1 type 2